MPLQLPRNLAFRRLTLRPRRLGMGAGLALQSRQHEGITGLVQAASLSGPLSGPAEDELLTGAEGSVGHGDEASSRVT